MFAVISKIMVFLSKVWHFYRDGFREMTWGRTLWVIILIKVFIIFAVLRVFFFRPALAGLDETGKTDAVAGELLRQGEGGVSAPGQDTRPFGQ